MPCDDSSFRGGKLCLALLARPVGYLSEKPLCYSGRPPYMNSQFKCSESKVRSHQGDRLCATPLVKVGAIGAVIQMCAVRTLQVGSLLLLLLLFNSSGCAVCQYAERTTLNEPSAYWWWGDRKRSVKVYRSWADQAWIEYAGSDCGNPLSDAYETGFKDGFVDYVFAGGSGEPPPVPPRKYWNVGVRSSDAAVEAQEWFAGYRTGAQVAHNEGYRERTIVPATLFYESDLGCWEDQPCLDQPSTTPMPEVIDRRLPQPQQFPIPENLEEVAPTLPSDQPQPADGLDPEILGRESLPLPEHSNSNDRAPALDEPGVSEPALKSSSPEPLESDEAFEDVFDTPAASRSSMKSDRIEKVNYLLNHKDAQQNISRTNRGVAAFSAAMRAASSTRSQPRSLK